MKVNSVRDLMIEAGDRVFVRCDFNVPIDEFGNITDDRRIREALPTIKYLLDIDAKIVLASHMGRPKGEIDPKYSLEPIAQRVSHLLHQEVILAEDVVGEDAISKFNALQQGEILLLENLRFDARETKNDEKFAQQLSNFGDFYINDAFGVSHRAHSSVHSITKYFDEKHKGAGYLLLKEINFFHKLLKNPARPFTAVVGGSKVSGKLQALINLLPKVDKMIIGGGMGGVIGALMSTGGLEAALFAMATGAGIGATVSYDRAKGAVVGAGIVGAGVLMGPNNLTGAFALGAGIGAFSTLQTKSWFED